MWLSKGEETKEGVYCISYEVFRDRRCKCTLSFFQEGNVYDALCVIFIGRESSGTASLKAAMVTVVTSFFILRFNIGGGHN